MGGRGAMTTRRVNEKGKEDIVEGVENDDGNKTDGNKKNKERDDEDKGGDEEKEEEEEGGEGRVDKGEEDDDDYQKEKETKNDRKHNGYTFYDNVIISFIVVSRLFVFNSHAVSSAY